MSPFQEALKLVFEYEGVYSDHANDSGGATKYGITQKVARSFGYKDDMIAFPKYIAETIYYEQYWKPMGLDEIGKIHPEVAVECFECGVNMGNKTAVKFLQQSLNSMNRDKRMRNLMVDGSSGKKTLRELRRISNNDVYTLVKMQNVLQGARYITLSQRNKNLKVFIRGWFKRVML